MLSQLRGRYSFFSRVSTHLRLPRFSPLSSDVWALGVLLYKLCYYTTPFEEHGPLAILNVHYKIPPYPVYSQNMINLIGTFPLVPTPHLPLIDKESNRALFIMESFHSFHATKIRKG